MVCPQAIQDRREYGTESSPGPVIQGIQACPEKAEEVAKFAKNRCPGSVFVSLKILKCLFLFTIMSWHAFRSI